MASAWELISASSPSAASSVEFTNLSSYRALKITGILDGSTSGSLYLRTSTNNGSSYDSGGTDYGSSRYSGGSASHIVQTLATISQITIGALASDTRDFQVFELILTEFNQAEYMYLNGICGGRTDGITLRNGIRHEATARDAIQIFPSAGTITGEVILEGHS